MADTDYGLLGGIGSGLSSFADSYSKQKQLNKTNDLNQQYVNMAKQREQMGLLQNGMEASPDGGVQYNPEQAEIIKNKRAVEQAAGRNKIEGMDPNSNRSLKATNFHRNLLNMAHPGMGDSTIQDGMSEEDLKEYEPFTAKVTGDLSLIDRVNLANAGKSDIARYNGDVKAYLADMANQQKKQHDLDMADIQKTIQGMKGSQAMEQIPAKGEQAQKVQELKGSQQLEQIPLKGDEARKTEEIKGENQQLKTDAQLKAGSLKQNQAARDKIRQALAQDKVYQDADSTVALAKTARQSLQNATNGNAIEANMIPILATRMKIGKNRLTNVELSSAGGSKAVDNRINNFFQKASSGTLTPADADFYAKLIESSAKDAEASRHTKRMEYVKRYANDQGVVPEQGYKDIFGEDMPKVATAPKVKSKGGGLIQKKSSGSKAPPVGTVKNGYKFKGGDPADQKNWEEQGFFDKAKGLLGF